MRRIKLYEHFEDDDPYKEDEFDASQHNDIDYCFPLPTIVLNQPFLNQYYLLKKKS